MGRLENSIPVQKVAAWREINAKYTQAATLHPGEAEAPLRQCLDWSDKNLGPEHAMTVAIQEDLAQVRAQCGDLEEAIKLNTAAWEAREKAGDTSREAHTVRKHLAGDLVRAGRLEEGAEHFKGAYDALGTSLGMDDPVTLRTGTELGMSWYYIGVRRSRKSFLRKAKALHSDILDRQRKLDGGDEFDMAQTEAALADDLIAQGDHESALAYIDSSMAKLARLKNAATGYRAQDISVFLTSVGQKQKKTMKIIREKKAKQDEEARKKELEEAQKKILEEAKKKELEEAQKKELDAAREKRILEAQKIWRKRMEDEAREKRIREAQKNWRKKVEAEEEAARQKRIEDVQKNWRMKVEAEEARKKEAEERQKETEEVRTNSQQVNTREKAADEKPTRMKDDAPLQPPPQQPRQPSGRPDPPQIQIEQPTASKPDQRSRRFSDSTNTRTGVGKDGIGGGSAPNMLGPPEVPKRPRSISPDGGPMVLSTPSGEKVFVPPALTPGTLFDVRGGRRTNDCDMWFNELGKTQALLEPLRPGSLKRVKVAVLDTGIDLKQINFWDKDREIIQDGKNPRIKAREDFLDKENGCRDLCGHGTHCVGVIRRVAPQADVYVGRVAKDFVEGASAAAVVEAIKHARDVWKVDIISLSFGFEIWIDDLSTAISDLKDKTLVFAATSNFGTTRPMAFPSTDPHVIAINAADRYGFAAGTNPSIQDGKNLTILGVDMISAWISDAMNPGVPQTHAMTGTSVATPVAAGVAALVLEFAMQKDMLDKQTTQILKSLLPKLKRTHGMKAVFQAMGRATGAREYLNIVPWKVLKEDRDNPNFSRMFAAFRLRDAIVDAFGTVGAG
ncbi:uncharacterized protein DNG_06043 [Cephalotrichum gorgonifer]|uniref:Peptidase S8/S53 domain-containing protein n=1 Tax=Cephalotrichum gorgonifer TaxID=2041049 RepID=A0AAE8SW41_9PEZI|nr:uncharacterized protein DNG_06043 [Cephalotrichum gorgonifer]